MDSDKSPGSEMGASPNERAVEFLADIRFHRSLWVPSSQTGQSSKPVRVTYSDLGERTGRPVLFCGGMFGTRLTLALADGLAREHNVRLIWPDKPGIGGSDPVPLDRKVKAWLDLVPALLQHLGIEHVALVGHSSGAIYVLNTLLRLRHILHPNKPYAALVTPWVYPSHSEARSPSIARRFPSFMIRGYYFVSRLVSSAGYPMLGPATSRPGLEMKNSDEFTKAVDENVQAYALVENVEGVSQEALFCLRRGAKDLWGPWKDYDEYIPLLREQEAGLRGTPKLTLQVFFAEEDNTSGREGSQWFEAVWRNSLDAQKDDWINYTSSTEPGTTHETIIRPEFGVLSKIFQAVPEEQD